MGAGWVEGAMTVGTNETHDGTSPPVEVCVLPGSKE
jgi:hypothetical protein